LLAIFEISKKIESNTKEAVMGKKNLMIAAVGLIFIIVAAGVAYRNGEDAKQAKSQVDMLSGSIQQKDQQISKLTKELKGKQDELSAVKAELDNAKKALEEAKSQVNKPAVAASETNATEVNAPAGEKL
jgi:septal ring factor EnvC (AmiA/AmiB activator)